MKKQAGKVTKSKSGGVGEPSQPLFSRFRSLTAAMAETSKNMSYADECKQLPKMAMRKGVGGKESASLELQNGKRRLGKITKLRMRADVMLVRACRHVPPAIPATAARHRLTKAAIFVRLTRNVKAIKSPRDHAFTANAIRNAKRLQVCSSCNWPRRTSRPITNCCIRVGTLVDNGCQVLNSAERNVRPQSWKVEASGTPNEVNGGKSKYWSDQGEGDNIIKSFNARNSVKLESALVSFLEKYSADIVKTRSQIVIVQQCASDYQNPLKAKKTIREPKKCNYLDSKVCKIVDKFQAEDKPQALEQTLLRTQMQQHLPTYNPALLQNQTQISQQSRYHTTRDEQLERSPKTQGHIAPQSLHRRPTSHEVQLHATALYSMHTQLRTQTATQTLLVAKSLTQAFVAAQPQLASQDRTQPETMISMQPNRLPHAKICSQLTQASRQSASDAIPEHLHASNKQSSRLSWPSRQLANHQNSSISKRHNIICALEQQQTQSHSYQRTSAQSCPQRNFQAQHTNRRPYATKPFSAAEFLTPLSVWRDWLFRALLIRRYCHASAKPLLKPPRDTTSSQLHLAHLWGCVSQLLFFSTVLFLLSALPSTNAACRDEPARPCEAICLPDGSNCTLRALLLLPDDETYVASMRRSLPVMHLAEQYLHENSLLPPQLRWEWMTGDVKCEAAYATIKAMDGIVKNCAHVVFGPVCDYALAAVSRIAKYFNHNGTPVISIGGATDSFELQKTSCADEFYMLLRSGLLSFKSISLMIIELLKRYNWYNSILFYEQNGQSDVAGEHSCYLMMKSFGNEMRDLNLTFAQYSIIPELRNRTEELKREIGNKHADLNTVCSYSDDSEHDSVEVAQVFKMSDSSEIAKCSNKPNKVNGKTKFIDD